MRPLVKKSISSALILSLAVLSILAPVFEFQFELGGILPEFSLIRSVYAAVDDEGVGIGTDFSGFGTDPESSPGLAKRF
ncbi:MAG: hypothetical protein HYT98_02815 [Candidatus Sungbacteria bacterium]|nr:hypothetical protein [Candidatus Sungbacteria bacterium]